MKCKECKYGKFCFGKEVATKGNYHITPCSNCKHDGTNGGNNLKCEECEVFERCKYEPIKQVIVEITKSKIYGGEAMKKLYGVIAVLEDGVDFETLVATDEIQAKYLACKMYSDWQSKTLVVKEINEVDDYKIVLQPNK